jgi:very-short-patch-repair endonuclease
MRQTDRQTAFARDLRQRQTPAERRLWQALRDRRLCGLKFRRQVPLGRYTVDFYCAEARLIVEADGGGHGGAGDTCRDAALRQAGFTVLRLWNTDITTNLTGVLDLILSHARAERP